MLTRAYMWLKDQGGCTPEAMKSFKSQKWDLKIQNRTGNEFKVWSRGWVQSSEAHCRLFEAGVEIAKVWRDETEDFCPSIFLRWWESCSVQRPACWPGGITNYLFGYCSRMSYKYSDAKRHMGQDSGCSSPPDSAVLLCLCPSLPVPTHSCAVTRPLRLSHCAAA